MKTVRIELGPVLLATVLACAGVFAGETGYRVTAKSLEYEDVKAAVTDVRSQKPDGHGTILLPAGDADWGSNKPLRLLGGINLIGQGVDQTIIRWGHSQPAIIVNAPQDVKVYDFGPMRISGISFTGGANGRTAIKILSVEGFRIDHCSIETDKNYAYMMVIGAKRSDYPRPYGVIDHCSFKANGKLTYGVYVGSYLWPNGDKDYLKYLGELENVFIEDCTFEGLGHHFALFDGGCAVFRYNKAVTYGLGAILDSHELAGNIKDANGVEQEHGGRCMEVYENTFETIPGKEHSYACLRTRNGGGVMFNNVIKDAQHPFVFVYGKRTFESTTPPGEYPGLDQVHFWWVWDNDVQNPEYDEISLQETIAEKNIKEDRDYFLESPDPSISHLDDAIIPGFTEPDYKPYTYPHPLVSSTSSE